MPCSTKVHLPVRHYGRSDIAVGEGLGKYLEGCEQGFTIDPYLEALKSAW